MTEIALGWCAPGPLPAGIHARAMADVLLLSAQAKGPEDVLAQQLLCFNQGLDLLPLSPARLCPIAEAEAATQPHSVQQGLRMLKGMAQISLHLEWDDTDLPVQSGRDFLAARRARSDRGALGRSFLTELARATGLPASEVEQRRASAVMHLLAPRTRLPTTESLASLAPPLTLPGARLTLIGPWPPIAFAALT